MTIIYANILFYLLILYGLAGAFVVRMYSDFWNELDSAKSNYDIIGVFVCLWLISTIIGLIMRKAWAYSHALALNLILFIIPIILFSVASVMLWQELDHLESFVNYLDHFAVSLIALGFWLFLYKSSNVKQSYNKSSNLTGAHNAPPS